MEDERNGGIFLHGVQSVVLVLAYGNSQTCGEATWLIWYDMTWHYGRCSYWGAYTTALGCLSS